MTLDMPKWIVINHSTTKPIVVPGKSKEEAYKRAEERVSIRGEPYSVYKLVDTCEVRTGIGWSNGKGKK
jgi:hypothetical protein